MFPASGEVRSGLPPARWVFLCRRVDQGVLVGVGGGRRAAREAQLHEDVAHVTRHGLLADPELLGDHAIGLACGDQAKDLDLACTEPLPGRLRAGYLYVGAIVLSPRATNWPDTDTQRFSFSMLAAR